jgi:8-oxo-dGTP pyrophosphatase MutT (NUDIX family)
MDRRTDSFEHVSWAITHGPEVASSDFDLNPGHDWGQSTATLRPAAVLVPLIKRSHGLNVILTKRASHLKHHPGQIAFPGGKVDEADRDVTSAALREANEEIGLKPDNVSVLGSLPFHHTVTSFQVTPIVGHVLSPFTPMPEAGEVAEVFEVPLSYLSRPENFIVEGRHWGGTKRYYYTIPYGPYYIWGATARILRGFAERLVRA